MPRYYISLGSNIKPELNTVLMLKELLTLSSEITISRIIETKPVGMVSDNYFLNLCACLTVDAAQTTLKQTFNDIEAKLGRDRSDAKRSKKDRPADLDILFSLEDPDSIHFPLATEYPDYVMIPLIDLLQYQDIIGIEAYDVAQAGIQLEFEQLQIGTTATTIVYDSNSRTYSLR